MANYGIGIVRIWMLAATVLTVERSLAGESEVSLQDETVAIQARIDATAAAGGGKVELAKGDHLIRSLLLKSNVELHLQSGARLVGSRDPDAYMMTFATQRWAARAATNRWANAMIRILGAHDVAITGEPGCEIDGRNCYDAKGEEGFRGPHAISAYSVTNLVLRGLAIRDAGNFGLYFHQGAKVSVERLDIRGGHDGLDFFYSSDIKVADCVIHSGDDCVAGYNNCNLTVRSCDLNTSCNVFRLGGNHLLVENCHARSPGDYPHRWSLPLEAKKLERVSAGAGRRNTLTCLAFFTGRSVKRVSSDIVFRNCQFEGVDQFLHYNLSGNERWQRGRGLGNIVFENVTATGLKMPSSAYGQPLVPLDLTLRNCKFSFRKPVASFIRGAYPGKFNLEKVEIEGVDGALMESWQGKPEFDVREVKGAELKSVVGTGEFREEPI